MEFFQNLVQTYSLENLLGERKKGHPLKLQGHSYFDPEDCSSSDEGENEKNQKNICEDLVNIVSVTCLFLSAYFYRAL